LRPRLLLDTHILARWFFDSKKLSKPQLRAMETAIGRGERMAFSAISVLEIAMLAQAGRLALTGSLNEFFTDLNSDPIFSLLPLSYEIAIEAAALEMLKDPADRVIAATALTHRLRLVTSDQRIIDSKLVPVVE
jgi:PIN domain nuclease of toxin-antitoxin system